MVLLDTDVLIDVQKGHPPAVAWFTALTDVPSVAGLVVIELIQGARDARQVREAQKLVAAFPVVWPTASDGQRALVDFATFHLSHSLGLLDAMIGHTAVGLNATLYTFNQKHYRVIAGLVIAQPYVR